MYIYSSILGDGEYFWVINEIIHVLATHVFNITLLQKLGGEPLPGKEYYVGFSGGFTIQHYAGKVHNINCACT